MIYRNLVGDCGTDYLLTHPGRGDVSGTGLTWHELVRLADSPSSTAEGVEDTAARRSRHDPAWASPLSGS
ncbi:MULTISPECIES: hypothetical protein [unclassified Streptomyces]|uniref:hypothetical protein n=1 Tax=unclassified Streptomyces TaxID=2593676 RepID=UPI002E16110B|nr:hypothetical protein OG457_29605 [Streptomyces sp. NBC_01207]WTA20762.1 hypothetical protein OG365_23490 [Streptomyces sp. NBC_00853]